MRTRSIAVPLLAVMALHAAESEAQTSISNSSTNTTQATEEIDEIIVLDDQSTLPAADSVQVRNEFVVDSAATLERLAGAAANRNGPLTGIAQYRGMFGDRVAVSLDGIGIIGGGPNAMDAPLSYVSPMITEEITLERGIPGVASAPEAVGGHITASVARGDFGAGDSLELGGMAGLRYADNGSTSMAAGRLTLANRGHRISVVGEVDNGDDLSTPAGDIVPSALDRRRYDASYAYRGEASEVLLYAGKLETRDTGTPALAMDIGFIDSELYGLRASHKVSPALTFSGHVGYNNVDHGMDNFSLRPPPPAMRHRQNLTAGNGYVFALSGDAVVGAYQVTAGVDGRLAQHQSRISNPNNQMFFIDNFVDIERDVLGAFTSVSRQHQNTDWELGLRYTSVVSDAGEVAAGGMMGPPGEAAQQLASQFNAADRSLSYGNVDAVFKVRRRLGTALSVTLDAGTRSRAPSYQELYLWLPLQATGGLADGRNYVGNLELDTERTYEVAAGLDWSTGRLSFSPQAYYKRIPDYIQGVPASDPAANQLAMMMSGEGALQFANVDAEIYGVDLHALYRLNDQWFLGGTASYLRGQRRDADDYLYRLAPPNARMALERRGSVATVRAEVIGYTSQDKVAEFNGEQATSGYAIVNLHGQVRIGRGARLELMARNLFDRGYQNHLAGVNRVAGVDIPAGERLYGVGRTIGAGLVIDF